MRRGGKKEGKGDSGSGKDAAKEKRPPAKWVPVALEEEFPTEFRHTALLATLLFVGVLSVYAATMHPSVSGGDNGELLGCACELGIAHPPGYPTFTMLGFLFFKFFPFGRPAFRIGFMSAMCDAMAGVLVMLCVQRWVLLHEVSTRRDRRKKTRDSPERAASVQDNDSAKEAEEESDVFIGSAWLGLLGGGLYSLSPLVWMYSVQAEVFAMNNMFAALLLYLIIRYNEQRSPQLAYLGALCIGLGLTNQHTLVLYAVPVVVWALLQDKCALCAPRHFGVMVALGLLGLTPYIFLYTHVNYAPLGSWGNTGTLDGFITHFTRKEYGTFQLYSGGDAQQKQVLKGTLLYLNAMTEDCLQVGLPLMLAGMVYAVSERLRCRRETPITPILCAWVFYLIVFHSLSNLPIDKLRLFLGIHMRFWMQPHLVSFMLVALGFKAVISHPMVMGGQLWQRHFVVPLVLSLLLAQVGLNYKKMDQSDNTHVAELGKKCLQYMPKNSIIISQGDMVTNAMRYLQRCEKYRTDVLLLDETMMTYKWMRDVQGVKMQPWGIVFPNHYHAPPSYTHIPDTYSMEQFLAANAKNFKKHPLFKAGAWLGDVQGLADSGVPSWHLVPVGLISKVMRKGKDMSADDWLKWYNKKLFPAEPDYYRFDDAAWEWLMRRIVLEWRAKVAFRFANIAVEKAKETGDISWIKNGTADMEDILRLEMLPEGGKDKSYILADLYNAIGMMTVHMQDWTDDEGELAAMNERVAFNFDKFVQLTPNEERAKTGQEAQLVKFIRSQPGYARPIIPREGPVRTLKTKEPGGEQARELSGADGASAGGGAAGIGRERTEETQQAAGQAGAAPPPPPSSSSSSSSSPSPAPAPATPVTRQAGDEGQGVGGARERESSGTERGGAGAKGGKKKKKKHKQGKQAEKGA